MVVWVLAAEQRVPVPGQSGQGPRVSTGVASAGPSFSQMFFTRPRTWRTWFSGRAMGPACLSSSNHSLFPQCLWCFLDPKESKRWARGSLVSQAPGHFIGRAHSHHTQSHSAPEASLVTTQCTELRRGGWVVISPLTKHSLSPRTPWEENISLPH